MRYWHWSQRRSYCSMPPFQEVLEEFEGIQKSVFFSLLVISQLKSIHLSRCVHIPERSAMHQKWYEPALCQKWGRLSDQSAQGVKQVLQQNPEPHKDVWDYTIIDWFLGRFWSSAGEFSVSASLWRGSPLVVCVECCSVPTCWFSASCWVNEDWLTLHLAHCSLPGPWIGELFVGSPWRCRPVKDISPGPLSTICLPPALRKGRHLGTEAMWHEQGRCVKGLCTEASHGNEIAKI